MLGSARRPASTDIIITEDDIPVDSKGKGRQCFIKTEFALRNREHSLHVLLLEEPENHLSQMHMRKLIGRGRQKRAGCGTSRSCDSCNGQCPDVVRARSRARTGACDNPSDTGVGAGAAADLRAHLSTTERKRKRNAVWLRILSHLRLQPTGRRCVVEYRVNCGLTRNRI